MCNIVYLLLSRHQTHGYTYLHSYMNNGNWVFLLCISFFCKTEAASNHLYLCRYHNLKCLHLRDSSLFSLMWIDQMYRESNCWSVNLYKSSLYYYFKSLSANVFINTYRFTIHITFTTSPSPIEYCTTEENNNSSNFTWHIALVRVVVFKFQCFCCYLNVLMGF